MRIGIDVGGTNTDAAFRPLPGEVIGCPLRHDEGDVL